MGAFLDRLKTSAPALAWDALPADAGPRLERFATASPLYAHVLEQHPAWALQLETASDLREPVFFQTLLAWWRAEREENGKLTRESPAFPGLLRRFRRKMSLRIAYRDVADFATGAVTVEELTRLAELCLRESYLVARLRWTQRLGEPWDETTGRAARFCVLGLGKLGGRELNFSSDVDLVFLYEGEGHTRRDGRATTTSNAEFFHRLADNLAHMLNEHDANGFLFRADLRLRPGGEMAPLVPSIEAVENYYAATGQTWERLALIKARPIVGDLVLGAELLENLHSFRYPRHPPPSLLAEIAAMKARTECEVVGADSLERDVKSGFGGIREIEFLVQAMQLLHAGRFPFLQTHATIEALRQLVRYELLGAGDAAFLEEAYWLLRRVEHRVQMREERRTHALPADAGERGVIARSLGFADVEAFDARLASVRARVRERYAALFRDTTAAETGGAAFDAWWQFLAENRVSDPVAQRIAAWFGDDADAARELRLFVRGSESQPLLREHVQRFSDLVPALDRVVPRLARPRDVLRRISAFAERYGSRNQFLAACTMNPQFFEVLALLFDRSRFIHELLCGHPEIFDEVLRPEILRKRKDAAARARELAEFSGADATETAGLLWLYVRAEQVRIAIGQLLGFLDDHDVEGELTGLAEAVVNDAVRRVPGAERLLIVALGKFGGRELTFGSDLDLVFVGDDDARGAENAELVRALRQLFSGGEGRDPAFVLDLRLRPHGDVGALAPGVAAYRSYFAASAQTWERQVLTRARVLRGPAELARMWEKFVEETIFSRALPDEQIAELWRMRLRIQNERDVVQPPERAFKTGAGGLIDIEYAVQWLQLRHGWSRPALRTPNTRLGWLALEAEGIVEADVAGRIMENHTHLKRIEWCLRRDQNRGVTVIPETAQDQQALARWLEVSDWPTFWENHRRRMHETRELVLALLAKIDSSTTLERGR